MAETEDGRCAVCEDMLNFGGDRELVKDALSNCAVCKTFLLGRLNNLLRFESMCGAPKSKGGGLNYSKPYRSSNR